MVYICGKTVDLDSFTKVLQCDETTFSEVRTLSDVVVIRFTGTESSLESNASNVEWLSFESALVNIQLEERCYFSNVEKRVVAMIRT